MRVPHDIVYVGTIHPYHYSACMLFLEHGKHVLCEKPVTMTQDECQQLVDKAREKKLFFMEGIWTRFFPAFRAVREELKTGSLGQITFVRACFLSPARAILKANNKKRCAGGALMARGTYPVQFAQLVFGGKPDKIVAVRQMFDEETGGDIGSVIILRYPGGATAVLYYNEDSADGSSSVTIHGTQGNLEIHDDMHTPTSITLPSGESKYFPLPEAEGTSFKWPSSIGFVYQAQAVRTCLQQGLLESPEMTHEDSLNIVAILEEARAQLGMKYEPPQL
nr:hypothetical protein BaRGS_001859 [Batillaria attramentaria]